MKNKIIIFSTFLNMSALLAEKVENDSPPPSKIQKFKESIKSELKTLDKKIDGMEEDIKKQSSDAQEKLRGKLKEARVIQKDLEKKIKKLNSEAQSELQKASDEIEVGIVKLKIKVKEILE